MFWRAGFNRRHVVICRAVITRGGRAWRRPARLVRFLPSGELAWVGAGGISWPEHVEICSHPSVRHAWVPAIEMPSCGIATHEIDLAFKRERAAEACA